MKEIFEEQLKEVIAIAETCPELYKVECFKILLEYQLRGSIKEKSQIILETTQESEVSEEKPQREIVDSDLDMKFRKFMERYKISLDKINQLFYIEGESFFGIYDDLKTLKLAEIQIRVALLQAMINAMNNGEFEFDGEAVRAECQKRKAYDLRNFATNFKNNSQFFVGFGTYKKEETVKLSEDGKRELSIIIEEISAWV